MKKFGIFACAALATLCTARLSAAVESDIVGYTTITMEAGKWYQIGCPFISLDKDVVEVSIDEIYKGFSDGDAILVYDNVGNTGYRSAYWRSAAKDGVGGWCTSSGGPLISSTIKVKPGDAVFIDKQNGNLDLMFSGKVSYEEVPFGHEDGNAWAMVTPVWPEAIMLNKVNFTELGEGDAILIYTPETGYKSAYWRPTANQGAGGWCTTSGGPTIAFNVELKGGSALFINKKTPNVGKISVK
jgi:hypothetical protein